MELKYDFSGWATRNDLVCSDGRTIRQDAFKDCDGMSVPLVWNHQHDTASSVLGHALLENRKDGVYAYCSCNDTESGRAAKLLVEHGDVDALSIYANNLKQHGGNVLHGAIREVSLVIAGANPGATIDFVNLAHCDENECEAYIRTGEPIYLRSNTDSDKTITLSHADDSDDEKKTEEEKPVADETKNQKEKTVGDVVESMTEEQKNVMYALIGEALQQNEADDDDDDDSKGGETDMKHNVFDGEETQTNVLSHSDMEAIFSDAKRYGSLKDSVIAHGIDDIDYLFPDERNVTDKPGFIQRDTGWVSKVMGSVHHTPFSRIKSLFADITVDDARAKGYIKGNYKIEEVFGLLKRTTTPTTIYKKQKLDRDDVIDITDFDVVAWLKSEMRMMLDEEIARAVLTGDGRSTSSDDKINESNVRPIMTDEDLYTIKVTVSPDDSSDDDSKASAFIRAAIKARKDYKGSGQPTLYTTEDMLINCLLLTDGIGRDLYTDVAQLAKKLRVKEIITVPVMEDVTGPNGGELMGIIVNLVDYNIGADKGGAVSMFDDFDIDYNAQKYLIETRCSGALIKPYSAIVLELEASESEEDAG